MAGHLICIGGLSGVGKTTVASRLTDIMNNAARICPDEIRLELMGKDPNNDVLQDKDITDDMTYKVIDAMKARAETLLEQGKTVIVGSSFGIGEMRKAYKKAAEGIGADFTGIWLDADIETRVKRAQERLRSYTESQEKGQGRGLSASITSEEKVKKARIRGKMTWLKVNARNSKDAVFQDVLNIVKASHAHHIG